MIARRHQYTVGFKLKAVHEITDATTREENPMSIRMACKEKNITPKMFRDWKKNITHLRRIVDEQGECTQEENRAFLMKQRMQ